MRTILSWCAQSAVSYLRIRGGTSVSEMKKPDEHNYGISGENAITLVTDIGLLDVVTQCSGSERSVVQSVTIHNNDGNGILKLLHRIN